MPSLYALLVAINGYLAPVPPLDGCIHDADSMEALLRSRFDATSLHLLRLNDEAATRQAVIDNFRSHLGQAQKDDLAVFFYAGHGSQAPTGGLFATIEPSGMNSTIVCYDSRLPNGLDLVDKDMAVLISEVTARGVHLTTIFDSCHSSSMDRALGIRKVEARPDSQPAGKYLVNPAAMEAAIRDSSNPQPGMEFITLAVAATFKPDETGRHILLAACETDQSAQEYIDPETGDSHGAFTFFLAQTLNTSKAALGYRELMHLVRASMSVATPLQTPKAESSSGDEMLNDLFLGLDAAAWTDYAVATLSETTNQWQLDRGATLAVSDGDRYALYSLDALNSDLADPGMAVALASVTAVQPGTATLQPDDASALDEGQQYKAVPATQSALNHVATWKKRLALANPSTQISESAVEFIFQRNPNTPEAASFSCPPTAQVEMPYRNVADSVDSRPTYILSIRNNWSARLYVALLYFSADYSISTGLLGAQTQFLDPGSNPVYSRSGTPLHASVPGDSAETTDEILLIASTDWFDATVYRMNPLSAPTTVTRGADEGVPGHDFFTRRIALHITRDAAPAGQPAAEGVTVSR
jgi:hypothetical protein